MSKLFGSRSSVVQNEHNGRSSRNTIRDKMNLTQMYVGGFSTQYSKFGPCDISSVIDKSEVSIPHKRSQSNNVFNLLDDQKKQKDEKEELETHFRSPSMVETERLINKIEAPKVMQPFRFNLNTNYISRTSNLSQSKNIMPRLFRLCSDNNNLLIKSGAIRSSAPLTIGDKGEVIGFTFPQQLYNIYDFQEFANDYDFEKPSLNIIQSCHRGEELKRKNFIGPFDKTAKRLRTKGTIKEALFAMEYFDMKYLKFSRQALCVCMFQMFERLGLSQEFNIKKEQLVHFVTEICKNYEHVPYHNFTHGFNVTHVCYYIIRQDEKLNFTHFSMLEKFALLLAVIGHDLKHPGIGNSYFLKSNHKLAQQLPDGNKSVLEHQSVILLTKIMKDSQILSNLSAEDYDNMIDWVSQMIHDTDMAKHNNVVERQDTEESQRSNLPIMSFILHASDISNPTQEFKDFQEWGIRVTQEFQDLYDAESDLVHFKQDENIANPPPFLNYKDWSEFCKGQAGFASMFVEPIWKKMADINPIFRNLHNRVIENIQKYKT